MERGLKFIPIYVTLSGADLSGRRGLGCGGEEGGRGISHVIFSVIHLRMRGSCDVVRTIFKDD